MIQRLQDVKLSSFIIILDLAIYYNVWNIDRENDILII